MSVILDDLTGETLELARELLGRAMVVAVEPIQLGRNNRVFRVRGRSDDYLLKVYPVQPDDQRDRFGRETAAVAFLNKHGMDAAPRLVLANTSARAAIFEWIEGVPVDTPAMDDIDAFAAFLVKLQEHRHDAVALEPASASCFSVQSALSQLDERLARLQSVDSENSDLPDFLEELAGAAARSRTDTLRACSSSQLDSLAVLSPDKRILSPSDFGTHNAIRRPDGSLAFVDFEYFGWDDPVKATADVMWHRGSNLSQMCRDRFFSVVRPALSAIDETFPARFAALYPVFGLIWCCLALNEFLPERWARRAWAGMTDSRRSAQENSLARARALFAEVEGHHGTR